MPSIENLARASAAADHTRMRDLVDDAIEADITSPDGWRRSRHRHRRLPGGFLVRVAGGRMVDFWMVDALPAESAAFRAR